MPARSQPRVRVRVPAKVNLSLAVGPARPDGFHELATVYQALSLFDEVEVTPRAGGRGLHLSVAGSEAHQSIPVGEGNLAWRAAVLAGQVFDRAPDLDIAITKGIPVAGGMAGGSADAAAVLRACAHLWDPEGHTESELLDIAAELGSDVPFALMGGTAVGTGRGEVVTEAMAGGTFSWVLALSDSQLATPMVYRMFDELTEAPIAPPRISPEVLLAVRTGDAAALGRALRNDLQPAAVRLQPVLAMLLELGPEHGALGSLVSGSGPTCAFLVADEDAAMDMAVALSASGLCRAVRRAVGPVPGAVVVSED